MTHRGYLWFSHNPIAMLVARTFCISAILLAANFCLFAQTATTFDASGKLTDIKLSSSNALAPFDVSKLKDANIEVKKKARDVLIQKLDETYKVLNSQTYKHSLHLLYTRLWGADTANIIAYIASVKKALDKQDTAFLAGAMAGKLTKPIKDNLLDTTSIFYTDFDPSHPTKISLGRIDPFNSFVVAYYNNTIGDIPNDITVEVKFKETNYLLSLLSETTDVLKEGRDLKKFSLDYFNLSTDFTKKFGPAGEADLIQIKNRFNADWFKEWFWFRSGDITLNPLDFTTADYLASHPQYDAAKAALFNQYMDSIIARQLRYDTVGKYNDFIEKLKLQSTGQNIFNFKSINDSLNKLNDSKKTALLTTKKVLNKVTIPASGDFFNYSAVTDITYPVDDEKLKQALHTTEKKTIALHNILNGYDGGLTETNKASDDNSAFQKGFDTVASQLGSFALKVASFTPYASILDFFSPPSAVSNPNLLFSRTVGSQSQLESFNRDTGTTLKLGLVKITYYLSARDNMFKPELKAALMAIQAAPSLVNDDLFNKAFPDAEDIRLKDINREKLAALLQKLNKYLLDLTSLNIHEIQSDSLFLTQLIQIYNQSTLPEPSNLKAASDDTPVYSTKILETHTSDDAIEKSVVIYTAKAKDTNTIAKFSYKVGKNYFFKLGAGVAYTLLSYDQTSVQQQNGQLTITNNIRQYHFIIGGHFYFCKGLYNQDNSFWKWSERNSLFVGVGIPDPLGNLYFAYSHDIVPGLKLSGGIHVAKSNKYLIQNNVILEEKLRYRVAGPYLAITLDPTSVLNVLNIFKKQ